MCRPLRVSRTTASRTEYGFFFFFEDWWERERELLVLILSAFSVMNEKTKSPERSRRPVQVWPLTWLDPTKECLCRKRVCSVASLIWWINREERRLVQDGSSHSAGAGLQRGPSTRSDTGFKAKNKYCKCLASIRIFVYRWCGFDIITFCVLHKFVPSSIAKNNWDLQHKDLPCFSSFPFQCPL